jgi:DNA polymerase III delta subunit
LVRDAVDAILERAGIDPSESFDHSEVDSKDVSAREILEMSSTMPFLGSRRSVVVRRSEGFGSDDVALLELEVARLPKSALVVFVFDPAEESGKATKLKAAIKKAGEMTELPSPKREKVIAELRRRAQIDGLTFGPGAAEELCNLTSDDLTEADCEFRKLAAACAVVGSISKAAVQAIVVPSLEFRVFAMLDAVCGGRMGAALQELDRLIGSSPRVEEPALRSLLPMLQRQVRLIWQARALSDAGVRIGDADASRFCPQQHNWPQAAQSDFVRGKISAFARSLEFERLAAMMECLLDTNRRLVGQLAQANARETLEQMVVRLCEIARG